MEGEEKAGGSLPFPFLPSISLLSVEGGGGGRREGRKGAEEEGEEKGGREAAPRRRRRRSRRRTHGGWQRRRPSHGQQPGEEPPERGRGGQEHHDAERGADPGQRGEPGPPQKQDGGPGSHVRTLQNHLAEGGPQVLVEERQDDRHYLRHRDHHPHLHHPLCYRRHSDLSLTPAVGSSLAAPSCPGPRRLLSFLLLL